MVGLYGMGGMGKTTICEALCNEFRTKFRGRVCHAELERVTEEDLLRDVLKRLSNTSLENLNGFNLSELRNGLREGKFIQDDPIFLVVDNMSDTNASIKEAKGYLSARLPLGSIVMVTTCYKEALVLLRPYIGENECMKMPELEEEEARSLFVKSSDGRNEGDEQLIQRCLERCRFWKDDGTTSYDYHPLALDALGRELAKLDDPQEWKAELDMIDADIFNRSNERNYHPIFLVLRKSFDTLAKEDQLLFMDVALFSPHEANVLEWLSMVHKLCVEDVVKALERLRKKSLLDSYGDGASRRSICMHDLWYEFCIAETRSGELKGRQWVYEKKTCNESSMCETSPSGNCWENVKRMAFLEFTSRSLERVNFAHFANVKVLMIKINMLERKLMVELSGLTHLRSLEIAGLISIQGLPRDLVFLKMEFPYINMVGGIDDESISHDQIGEQIGGLEELQCLHVLGFKSSKLPDMRNMISLREAIFNDCPNAVMDSGLSLNLRVLHISRCKDLRSCPNVGDLVVLEELDLCSCYELQSLPNLGRLRKLRKLNVDFCRSITELSGLGNMVALEHLSAKGCYSLLKLLDMRKLTNLRVLELWDCPSIIEVPGLGGLTSLEKLSANFRAVVEKPNLRLLTKLQEIRISWWSSGEIQELSNLTMLEELFIDDCSGVDKMPDFHNLTRLQYLRICDCEFKDLSTLSLSALKTLSIYSCNRLERLPDFQRLPSLEFLTVKDCAGLRSWDCTSAQDVEGRSCRLEDSSLSLDVPKAQMVVNLKTLILENCGIANWTSIGTCLQLERLEIISLPVTQLPDLSSFPQVKTLRLWRCKNLVQLTSREPLAALSNLEIDDCSILVTLPDICKYFKGLLDLKLTRCNRGQVSWLSSSGPLMALTNLEVKFFNIWTTGHFNTWTTGPDLEMFPGLRNLCLTGLDRSELHWLSSAIRLTKIEIRYCEVSTFPDLSNFSGLIELCLRNCEGITSISCNGPLTALTTLEVAYCNNLRAVPDLGMFPSLVVLTLDRCEQLATLSCSVPLTGLQRLIMRRCRSLSPDDLEKLRALCPQHELHEYYDRVEV